MNIFGTDESFTQTSMTPSLTLGAANDTCEHHMHYTHVVHIWKKGYKAALTRPRAALLHALFSGAGE
jgi:hypothetical protein